MAWLRGKKILTNIIVVCLISTLVLPPSAKSAVISGKAVEDSANATISADGKNLVITFGLEVYYDGLGDGESKHHVITVNSVNTGEKPVFRPNKDRDYTEQIFKINSHSPDTPDTPTGEKIRTTPRDMFEDKYFLGLASDKQVSILERTNSETERYVVIGNRSFLESPTVGEAFVSAYSFPISGPKDGYKIVAKEGSTNGSGTTTSLTQSKVWAECLLENASDRIRLGVRDFDVSRPEIPPLVTLFANPACKFPGLTAVLVGYNLLRDGRLSDPNTLGDLQERWEEFVDSGAGGAVLTGAAIGTIFGPGLGTAIGAIAGALLADLTGDVGEVAGDRSDNVLFYFVSIDEKVPWIVTIDAAGDAEISHREYSTSQVERLSGRIDHETVKAETGLYLNHIVNRVFMPADKNADPWCSKPVPYPQTTNPPYGPEEPESNNAPGKGRVGCLYTGEDGWLDKWGVDRVSSSGACGITDIIGGSIDESAKKLTECLVRTILRPMIEWATNLVQTAAGISRAPYLIQRYAINTVLGIPRFTQYG